MGVKKIEGEQSWSRACGKGRLGTVWEQSLPIGRSVPSMLLLLPMAVFDAL
jgi:hypothetical protein